MLTQIIITSMTAVFSLPQLPYETNALEPVISKETIDYHYGKHLQEPKLAPSIRSIAVQRILT